VGWWLVTGIQIEATTTHPDEASVSGSARAFPVVIPSSFGALLGPCYWVVWYLARVLVAGRPSGAREAGFFVRRSSVRGP